MPSSIASRLAAAEQGEGRNNADQFQAFKARAVADRLKLNELLARSFEAYCKQEK